MPAIRKVHRQSSQQRCRNALGVSRVEFDDSGRELAEVEARAGEAMVSSYPVRAIHEQDGGRGNLLSRVLTGGKLEIFVQLRNAT